VTETFWDFLKSISVNIPCEPPCGLCCPPKCDRIDQTKTLCTVHEDPRRKGVACDYSPIKLFQWGIPCPPVLKVVEKLTGERPKIVKIPAYNESRWTGRMIVYAPDLKRILGIPIEDVDLNA